jgi:hypothetical protein
MCTVTEGGLKCERKIKLFSTYSHTNDMKLFNTKRKKKEEIYLIVGKDME